MFEALLWCTAAVSSAGMAYAYLSSRDVFHPLMFISPMFLFLYWWMPLRLLQSGELNNFFDPEQVIFVQTLNFLGVSAFIVGCLFPGCPPWGEFRPGHISWRPRRRLVTGAVVLGMIGLACWVISLGNVGGFVAAFSQPYGGGWDDSGYVRDGTMFLLSAVILLMIAITRGRPLFSYILLLCLFGAPWLVQAILTSRRGPTFALLTVLAMGWYLNRNRRPWPVAAAVSGIAVGYLILFLVVNRQSIFLGSEREVITDVTSIIETPNTGNEYIYGTGAVLSADRRGEYFWGLRYLSQVVVRPIPTAIWPTKYADFGVPEILENAGTSEGFADTLGWEGADGSAPGIVADLWIEGWWFAVPMMAILGWCYGKTWRMTLLGTRIWPAQYAVLSALSIYLVMQTMEAVIFRCLLLSVPMWLVWKWATLEPRPFRTAALARSRLFLERNLQS
jgi:hypothetical protein